MNLQGTAIGNSCDGGGDELPPAVASPGQLSCAAAENSPDETEPSRLTVTRRLARVALLAFISTFVVARFVVYLIMSRKVPDFFLHINGTHVHHLNYGIFLLSGIGFTTIFARPAGKALSIIAALYGIGLALTFDEFGMLLHLGGGYWQVASVDAILAVAGILALLSFLPGRNQLKGRYVIPAMVCVLVLFAIAATAGRTVGRFTRFKLGGFMPRLIQIEQTCPS